MTYAILYAIKTTATAPSSLLDFFEMFIINKFECNLFLCANEKQLQINTTNLDQQQQTMYQFPMIIIN